MQHEHGPMLIGQLAERFIDARSEFAALESLSRIWRDHWQLPFHPAGLFVHLIDGLGSHALVFAQLVQAKIDDNARHPSRKTRIALKLDEPLPAFDPCFLRK